MSVGSASELVVSRDVLQLLVTSSLFKDGGKWYFEEGRCYAFLEGPQVSLSNGRLVLNAHFSSQLGVELFHSCVGPGFASNVTVSGRLVGYGSQLTLNDV